ncbi:MAG: hypothetical protein K2N63_14200 [Lachnospiraceae bacterium]|nr:hypothetical protein [Lachnospiraceae bacterium]
MRLLYRGIGFMFMVVCVFVLASCGNKTEGEVQKTEGMAGEISTTPSGSDADEGFSQKLGNNGEVGEALTLKGKAFGELAVVGEEDAFYCNLPENVMNWENVVPICTDPLYGILYYVDYGGDFMIHAVYNGQSQTVVELPGKRLFCRGGKLYFLLESYNQFQIEGAVSGNIMEYDPVTGNVAVLLEEVFDSIVVYQDMIYCRKKGESVDYKGDLKIERVKEWFYYFDSRSLVELECNGNTEYILNPQRYGEYFFAVTLKHDEEKPEISYRIGMELRTADGRRGTVWEDLQPSSDYYVKDNYLCWRAQDRFHMFDLTSGKEQTCAVKEDSVFSYIVVDGWIYGTENWLVEIEGGKSGTWFSMDEKLNYIFEFYTDGNKVYSIVGHYSKDKNPVLRLVQMKRGVERLSVISGGYVTETGFSFHPIGE